MKLDLSKFKKVKEDKNSATLMHPDGHQIKVAKTVLSVDLQNQLRDLPMHQSSQHFAEGGDVQDPNASYEPGSEPKQAPVVINIGGQPLGGQPQVQQAPQQQQLPAGFTTPGGGMPTFDPRQYALQSPDAPPQARQAAAQSFVAEKQAEDVTKQDWAKKAADKQMMDRNSALQFNQYAAQHPELGMQPASVPDAVAAIAPAADPNVAKLETLRAALMGGQQEQQAPQAQGPDLSSGYNMFKEGLQGQIGPNGSIQQQAKAEQAQNTAMGDTYGQAVQSGNDLNSRIQTNLSDMQKHTDAFAQDMQNQHIDPTRWWHDKSTSGKIMTAIGMMIGGMGAGLLKQDPMAFVNKLIENDINAQRADIDNKKSIYDANLNQFTNSNQALDMTRLNMNQMVQHMISQTAAKYGNPVIQAKANQMINGLKMDASTKMNEMAMRQAMMGSMSQPSGGSDEQIARQSHMLRMMGQKDMADNIDKRHVPGVGLAQIEVPQEVRTRLVNGKVFDDAIQDLQSFVKQHGSAVNKLTPELRNLASAKARRVQDLYRQANNQGVFKESEKEFVENSIKTQPLSFFSDWFVKPGLENTRQQNMQAIDELKQSVGLPKTYRPKSAVAFTGE